MAIASSHTPRIWPCCSAARVGVVERVAVLAHDAQERLGVLLVSGERAAAVAGDAGRLRVGLAGHHGRDGGCAAAGGVGVVGDGVRHQQRAQVRVAESQGAVGVRVAADRLGRVAGVVDQDLLGGDHGAHAGAEGVDVELLGVVGLDEGEQVQRREVARGVVQEHVLGVGDDSAVRGSGGRYREAVDVFDLEVVDGLRIPVDARRGLHVVAGRPGAAFLERGERMPGFQGNGGQGAAVRQVEPVLWRTAEHQSVVGRHLGQVVGFSGLPCLADLAEHGVSGARVVGDGQRKRSLVHRGERVDADSSLRGEHLGVAGEAARVGCVDPGRVRARVPLVDGRVELHPRVAALVCAFGDPAHQVPCPVRVDDSALAVDGARVPLAVVEHRAHELVGDPDAVVRVLEEDRGVGGTGQRPVVAGIDQCPGLALLLGLAVDEGEDVGMVCVEDHHLGGPAPSSARLDDAGEGVVALHEGDRSRRDAAACDRLARRADCGQVAPGSGAVLEQHALGLRQLEDRLHCVVDAQDEARTALRVVVPPAVEPDGAVERGFLVHEQVGEIVAERLAVVGGGEIAAVLAPPGDGVGDAGDELAHAVLALLGARVPAEVLVGDDVGRLLGPALRDLDAFLPENGLAVRVLDRGGAGLPFDVVVDAARRDVLGERPGEGESGMFRRRCGAAVRSGLCHRFSRFRVRAGAERRARVSGSGVPGVLFRSGSEPTGRVPRHGSRSGACSRPGCPSGVRGSGAAGLCLPLAVTTVHPLARAERRPAINVVVSKSG